MRRHSLIIMIAVVATAIALGPAANALPDSTTAPRSIILPPEKPRIPRTKIKERSTAARIEPYTGPPPVKPRATQAADPRIVRAAIKPRPTAADINRLIRRNANNAEIVRFADPREHPVKVVRGGNLPLERAPDDRVGEIVAFAGKRKQRVHILRGGPMIATVSQAPVSALPAMAAARPIRAAVQIVTFANRFEQPVTVLRGGPITLDPDQPLVAGGPDLDLFHAARGADLDRVAFAVDGAESSHGDDPGMWRPELDGPQGPMQVSAAAAVDSGGGDRFDLIQNRQLGRTYLARLFRRYGNWPDAIAAYNWGPGNMDAWIAQGRPAAGLPLGVERYRQRVLRDGAIRQGPGSPLSRTGWQLQTP